MHDLVSTKDHEKDNTSFVVDGSVAFVWLQIVMHWLSSNWTMAEPPSGPLVFWSFKIVDKVSKLY